MDFAKFNDEDFDPKVWINESFRTLDQNVEGGEGAGTPWTKTSGSSITPAEQLAGTAIMKLQLSIQELSASLEDSCQQMLQNVPRIVRDLDAVQQVRVFFCSGDPFRTFLKKGVGSINQIYFCLRKAKFCKTRCDWSKTTYNVWSRTPRIPWNNY